VRRGAAAIWPGREEAQVTRLTHWETSGSWQVFRALVKVDGEGRQLVFTSGPRERLQDLFTRHYGVDEEASPVAVLLPQDDFMVEVYPHDWKLRGLKHVIDPANVGRLLVRAGWLAPAEAANASISVDARRYFAHKRAVIRYSVATAESSFAVIGKVYSSAARAQRAYEVLDMLRESAAASIVPQPLVLRRAWSFVMMSHVPGEDLHRLLDQEPGSDRTREAVMATARSLALFHRVPVSSPPARGWREEAEAIIKQLATSGLDAGIEVKYLLQQLLREVPQESVAEAVFTHGDFNPRQVLFDDGTARIVDLDRAGPGEAAADVGRFVASLKARAIQDGNEACRPLAMAFQQEYDRSSGAGTTATSATHEAVALLHRAARLLQSPRRDIAGIPERLVAEARAALATRP